MQTGKISSPTSSGYPSFKEAFLFWLKLGFISFGGPAGQIAIMHEFLVEKKKWISESRFMHALNYCMLLPGPEAQQLATYIGWLLHGVAGGLTAGLLFIIPGLLILAGLSILYVSFGKLALVAAVFYGLKPAVIAIIITALIKISSRSLRTALHVVVAIVSFVLIWFFNVPFPWIVVGAILVAFLALRYFPSGQTSESRNVSEDEERQYIINRFQHADGTRLNPGNTILKLVVALSLWVLPLLMLYFSTERFSFWKELSMFFTKAAFVTFGGAYAVLPYVAQVSVEKYHWLSNLQMIDGMALGETTPGPLIIILVFVGFMAGYNNFNGSISAGTLGLSLTAFYTFLPSFLFILIGAPWVERTKDNETLKKILTVVTAAVVGVILNLTLYFGKSVLLKEGLRPDVFSIVWTVISLFALYRFKVNMILWILISGIAGMIYHVVMTNI